MFFSHKRKSVTLMPCGHFLVLLRIFSGAREVLCRMPHEYCYIPIWPLYVAWSFLQLMTLALKSAGGRSKYYIMWEGLKVISPWIKMMATFSFIATFLDVLFYVAMHSHHGRQLHRICLRSRCLVQNAHLLSTKDTMIRGMTTQDIDKSLPKQLFYHW